MIKNKPLVSSPLALFSTTLIQKKSTDYLLADKKKNYGSGDNK